MASSEIDMDNSKVRSGAERKPPTPPYLKRHIPALDGIRGFAAISIVLIHYNGNHESANWVHNLIARLFSVGWMGVPIFFVLSGFLISGILYDSFGQTGWWSTFYLKRSLRIFPLYYLALAIVFFTNMAFGKMGASLRNGWVFALYLQNLPVFRSQLIHFSPILPVNQFWSLAVEEQFYLIWPLLLLLAWRRSRALQLCFAVFVLSFLFRLICIHSHWSIDSYFALLPSRAGELSAGAFLALALRSGSIAELRVRRTAPYAFTISLLTLSAIIYMAGPEVHGLMFSLGFTALSVFAACLIYYGLHPGPVQRVFSNSVLRWFGKISYGLYVYHLMLRPLLLWLVFRYFSHSSHTAQYLTLLFSALILSPAIAALSFYTYESFFLHIKDRLTAARKIKKASVPA